jgi:hypothetical protein
MEISSTNSLKCTAPRLIVQVSYSNQMVLEPNVVALIHWSAGVVLPRRDLSQRFQSDVLCDDCVRKQQIIYNEASHYVKDESVSTFFHGHVSFEVGTDANCRIRTISSHSKLQIGKEKIWKNNIHFARIARIKLSRC